MVMTVISIATCLHGIRALKYKKLLFYYVNKHGGLSDEFKHKPRGAARDLPMEAQHHPGKKDKGKKSI